MGNIDRKSSIENEPRTLRMHQIQFAREAALYVINTTTIEEAMKIFTEGLQPVECKAIQDKDSIMGNYYHEEEDDELQSLYQPRDIVSAPF
ncbi:uncharacterized protein LOC120089256 [Benincasa hispida]|uniref:uncharacterized protein LOC120089256 n=1 Tax=Benincasa hispida TaxID=102211 RepID=UPI001901B148|nr:uncharacterized protein LOC120089256 [Benincasa hispida]